MSFVEKKLPTGYSFTFEEDLGGIKSWGWESGDAMREGFSKFEEACRSSWRHWTAAVLRGRPIAWKRIPITSACDGQRYDGYRASIGHVRIDLGSSMDRLWVVHVYRDSMGWGDIDEAMARFAALVLALERPV